MSTIARLAIKLSADPSGVAEGVKKTIQTLERLGASVVKQNIVVRSVAGAWKMADSAARGYLGTAAKASLVGGGLAVIAASIKSAASGSAASQLASSIKGIKDAVGGAGEAFSKNFVQVGRVSETANKLRNAIEHLQPAFAIAGHAAGLLFRAFSTFLPVIVGSILVFKALAVIIHGALYLAIAAASIALKTLIFYAATWLIFGKAMTPLSFAIAAAKYIWAGAQWALNAALAAGVPLLGAVLAAAIPIVAGLALVAGVVYGVYKAWQYLTTRDPAKAHAEQVAKLAKATREARGDLDKLLESAREEGLLLVLTDSEKKMRAFNKLLDDAENKIKEAGGAGLDREGLTRQFTTQQQAIEILKKRKEVTAAIADIEREIQEVGLDSVQKVALQMERMGATDQQKNIAVSLATELAHRERIVEETRKAAEADLARVQAGVDLVANAQKALDVYGMTATQIAAYEARAKGVSAADIAQYTAIMQKVEALEEEKKKREEIAKIGRDGAAKMAAEAKAVIDSVKTPIEKLQEKLDHLAELRKAGAISQEVYNRALAAEERNLRGSDNNKLKTRSMGTEGLTRGSQADIAARFRERVPDAQKDMAHDVKKQVALLEGIKRGVENKPRFEVADFN